MSKSSPVALVVAASCAVAATAVWAAWRRSKQVGKLVQRTDNGVELRFATIDDVDEILRLIKALAVVSADRYICRPAGSVHAPSPPLFSSLRSSVVAVRSPGGCGPIRLAILDLGFSWSRDHQSPTSAPRAPARRPHAALQYEKEPDAVEIDAATLARDGFGPAPAFECLLTRCDGDARPCGFALFFTSFSTWTGKCTYLEVASYLS
jgi:hypothetical protein